MSRASFRALPLRRQLFISIAFLLLPILAAVVWMGFTTLQEREQDVWEQARLVATTTAAFVNNEVASVDHVATALSTIPAIQSLNPVAAIDVLKRGKADRPHIIDLVLVSADGARVAQAADTPYVDEHRYHNDTNKVVEAGRRIVRPMEIAPDGKMQHMCFGYPVKGKHGQVTAVLWAVVSLEATQRTFAELPLPEGSVVTVTDPASTVLVRSLEPEKYVGRTLHGAAKFPEGEDSVDHTGSDGVRRMYVRKVIDRGPWVLSVGIPTRVAVTKATDTWTRSLAILGVGLAGWGLVAVMLSKRLSGSVQHLEGAAQRIASGDFGAIVPQRMASRELEELQGAFAQMLMRFNETRGELDRHLAEERGIRQQLQSLQSQVIRQERLAAVGQLVSGVAHEINNPLQAILGFAELLQMQGDVPESVKPDLRLIQKESARACAIIRNLALFARQQPGAAAPVKLTDVVNSVTELRQRRLESENIVLVVENKSDRPVLALLPELQQVALNFVVNAEQAIKMSGRLPGRITIRTYDAGDHVGLEVEDTGPGIPRENEAKLFQPFFTTKPVGQGTGLGLSVSYGIIDSLGGRIGVKDAPAGGAIFYFELPAVPDGSRV